MNFASDNTAPVVPEVMAAIEAVNHGRMASYGGDEITARLRALVCEVFETELEIFPVVTGTAANGLALASLAPPFGAVFLAAVFFTAGRDGFLPAGLADATFFVALRAVPPAFRAAAAVLGFALGLDLRVGCAGFLAMFILGCKRCGAAGSGRESRRLYAAADPTWGRNRKTSNDITYFPLSGRGVRGPGRGGGQAADVVELLQPPILFRIDLRGRCRHSRAARPRRIRHARAR